MTSIRRPFARASSRCRLSSCDVERYRECAARPVELSSRRVAHRPRRRGCIALRRSSDQILIKPAQGRSLSHLHAIMLLLVSVSVVPRPRRNHGGEDFESAARHRVGGSVPDRSNHGASASNSSSSSNSGKEHARRFWNALCHGPCGGVASVSGRPAR